MSSYAAAIELCKANVLFLNAGLNLKSTDLNLITWKEGNAFLAGIVTSCTTERAGGAPTINMLASGLANLRPGADPSDDSLIKEAIDAMLRDLQERIGQFAAALRIMPKQQMTAFLPKHYTGAIEGTGVWVNVEESPSNILKRMNPLRTRRKSSLKEIHPDKWANLREAADGIFTVDGKLVTRAQLSREDENHLAEFDQRPSMFWGPTRVVIAEEAAGSTEGEASGEVEGTQEEEGFNGCFPRL